MSSNTPNLGLLKKDPMADGNETFNIKTMLNDNWDKIDEAVGNTQVDIPDASTTQKGIVQLSNATDGTRENVAATEKAVNDTRNGIISDYIRQPGFSITDGTSTAYRVTLNPAPTSLPEGFGITILSHIASGANPTLNVNSLGAVRLRKQDGSAAEIKAGQVYTFRKIGSDFLADSGSEGVIIRGQKEIEVRYGENIIKSSPVAVRQSDDWVKQQIELAVLPTSSGNGVTFSPDGNYLAVAYNVSPYVTIFKRSGDAFTKLINPSVLPAVGNDVSFSPDGNYLAVGHYESPYLTIYKRSEDNFTKLANPAVLPTGRSDAVSFSPDGNYLAVGHASSPYVTIYKRSGDTFTKLVNPTVLPDSYSSAVSFSPDANYLALGNSFSQYLTIYKRSGDTFTKLANPADLPPGTAGKVSFSPDGNYLAVVYNDFSQYLTIYKRSGDTFTKLANPAVPPTGMCFAVSFSPDGNYLVVGHEESPYLTIYKRSGDTFTKLVNPAVLPTGRGLAVSFSPDGNYFAVGHYGSPNLTIYKHGLTAFNIQDITGINRTADLRAIGYAPNDGAIGDIKNIIAIIGGAV